MTAWKHISTRAWHAAVGMAVMILFGGCAAMGSSSALAEGAAEEELQVLFFQTQMALRQRDYSWVIEHVEPLRGRQDSPPELLLALSEAYLAERDWDKSIETVNEVLEANPEFVPALSRRAELYRRKGMKPEAIADLERALEIVPNHIAILESLGLLRLRSVENWEGDLSEDEDIAGLIRVYEQLMEIRQGREKVLPLIVLSSVRARLGQNKEAIELGKQAAEMSPQDLRAQLALAEAYEAADREEEALETYRQAVLIEPDNELVRAKVVELVEATDYEGGTMEFYRRLADEFPGLTGIQEIYGDQLLEAEQWDEAVEHFEKMVELRPDDSAMKTNLVRAMLLTGQEDSALILIEQMMSDESATVLSLLELAEMVREQGDLDLVIRLLEQVQAAGHDDARVPLALAQVQQEAGQTEEAIATLEDLLTENPESYPAVTALADLYSEQERYEEALALYEQLDGATRAQRENEIRLRKSELYRRSGKYDMAVAMLEEVMREGGELGTLALQMIIDVHTEADEPEKAQAAVDQYIASTSGEEQFAARNLKAYLYYQNDRHAEAVEILEELHAENPEDFTTIQFLAENYAELEQFEKAEGLLNAAAAMHGGELTDSHLLLTARLYRLQNRDEEALQAIERLLGRDRNNATYLMVAGEYYYEAGNLQKAEEALRRAIELRPDNAEAYNALGYFFAEAGINLDEAQRLILKALELNPDAGHILDSLGWVYYQQGRYSEALEQLQKAERLMAEEPDPVIYEHLGDTYEKLGRHEDALAAWRRALELDPEPDVEQSVRQKLANVQLKHNS